MQLEFLSGEQKVILRAASDGGPREVLSIMESQSLFAKLSKCEFGLREVLYLGHVIGAKGVKVHKEKIQTIQNWPIPRKITEL